MKVHNIRLGLATNSSSSHSMIFLPPSQPAGGSRYSDFGWSNFTLTSVDAKLAYLAATLFGNLSGLYPGWLCDKIIKGATGLDRGGAVIDHQSQLMLPYGWRGQAMHWGFVEDMKRYLSHEGLVILGGNDNSDGHPLAGSGEDAGLPLQEDGCSTGELIARKDGDWWTLFHRRGGAKVKMSFLSNPAPPVRPSTPELVDVKITDFCDIGCHFCALPGTLVETPQGERSIESLQAGDPVVSFNQETESFEEDSVAAPMERDYEGDIIEIELGDGRTLYVTPNHPLLTKRGWVPAGELTEEDEIVHLDQTTD